MDILNKIPEIIIGSAILFCSWLVREIYKRPTKQETSELIRLEMKELYVLTSVLKDDLIELKNVIKENNHELKKLSETLASINTSD